MTPFEVYSALSTDVMFRKTAIRIAEAQCKHASGGYNYLFCWKSPAAGSASAPAMLSRSGLSSAIITLPSAGPVLPQINSRGKCRMPG